MVKSEKDIIKEIRNHINQNGVWKPFWYVGITNDPEIRLFNAHGVNKKNGLYIYETASSNAVARRVETYFINEFGTDGGEGGGNEDTINVYAFKKTLFTKPSILGF